MAEVKEKQEENEEDEDEALSQLTYESFVQGQSLCSLCSDPRQWRPTGEASTSALARSAALSASSNAAAVLARAKAQSASQLREYSLIVRSAYGDFIESQKTAQQQEDENNELTSSPRGQTTDVPQHFFNESFDIQDPHVFELALGIPSDSNPNSTTTWMSEIESSRLGHWLDSVEVKIIEEVSKRSAGFFDALSTLEKLRMEVKNACLSVSLLRVSLLRADEKAIRDDVSLSLKCRRKVNIEELIKRLELIEVVMQAKKTVLELLGQSDFSAALDVINKCKTVLSGPLKGVIALKRYEDQLRELSAAVETSAHKSFVKLATEITPSSFPSSSSLPTSSTTNEEAIEARRLAFIRVVNAEIRLSRLPIAVDLWGQVSVAQIKKESGLFVRDYILKLLGTQNNAVQIRTISDNPPNFDESSPLGSTIISLSQTDFIGLIDKLLQRLALYSEQAFMTFDVLKSFLSPSSTTTSSTKADNVRTHLQDETLSSFSKVLESGHLLVATLVKLRSNDSTISLTELEKLYNIISQFAHKEEELLRKSSMQWISPTHAAIYLHSRVFLEAMHLRELKKIVLLLDNENWSQASVASEFQQTIDGITEGSDPECLGEDTPETLRIGNKRFKVVNSLLMLTKSLSAYLKLPCSLKILTCDVANKLAELIKAFNNRVLQLILGAEVTKLLNLKTISAKFLAITSQTLSALLELLPYIRATLHSFLSEPSEFGTLQQIDNVGQEVQNHLDRLFAKLSSLIRDRVNSHLGDKEGYKAALLASQDQCSVPMSRLCKEITSLHRVLSQYLSSEQVKQVFKQVGIDLSIDIPEIFERITIQSNEQQNLQQQSTTTTAIISMQLITSKLQNDLTYLVAIFTSLQNVESLPNSLIELVTRKLSTTPEPETSPTTQTIQKTK